MKRWSGQLFPIILLGLLAALSVWLERAVDLPEGRHDGKERHDPDTLVENFAVRRLTQEGALRYRLVSPYMEHYPDDDSSLIKNPTIVYYRPGAPDMTISSRQAYSTSKGETLFFWDNVVATRDATSDRPSMSAQMPDLIIQPDAGTGFTNSPVEIRQGSSWFKGVGMALDNNKSTFALQSQVTGLYFSPKAPQ